MSVEKRVVVAGHICLDIIPAFEGPARALTDWLVPGSLSVVGPAAISTGGVVSNTGIALHKLGVPTTLMGKIGDDYFGLVTRSVIESHGAGLSGGMLISEDTGSSYSVVLNPPGVDRMFLHFPGPNDTFGCEDVSFDDLGDAAIFHFGYPPLMRRMYEDEGKELELLFRLVKQKGLVTSLDMTMPDPASDQGRAPWRSILTRVLPHVDMFVPSIDEVSFMLDPSSGARSPHEVAAELLPLGASLLLLKLGEQGLFLKTSADVSKLSFMERLGQDPTIWAGLEWSVPAFRVDVAGTTGCGDSTVAGFMAAILRGLGPCECLTVAAAVGACTAERPDALSGVPSWGALQARLASDWPRRTR